MGGYPSTGNRGIWRRPLPSLAVLQLLYVLYLASLGSFMPFISVRLEAMGFLGGEIGFLVALMPFARLITSPLWGMAADRWRLAGLLLRFGTACSTVGGILLLNGSGRVSVALGLFLFAAGRAPSGPLIDALTVDALRAAGRDVRDYGRVRLWGSVGFLLAALGGGSLSPDLRRLFAEFLLVSILVASFAVPARGEGGPAPILPALRTLSRERFLIPLLVAAAFQALTLSVYDTFFASHVHARGFGDHVTAAAIAVGVAAEIALMRWSREILSRIGGPRLFTLAAVAGILRWWLTAHVVTAWAMVSVQLLHGLTFGAFWIAGVEVMSQRAPREVVASAQSLFASASYGVGAFAGAVIAGQIRERAGTDAIFLALACVSTFATAAALLLERRSESGEAGEGVRL